MIKNATISPYHPSQFKVIEHIYNISKKDEFCNEGFDFNVVPLSQDKKALASFETSNVYVAGSLPIEGSVGLDGNHISWLFVHPSARGKGVAKELVQHALKQIKGAVTLFVAKSNTAAINLYKSLGFEVLKESVSKFQDKTIRILTMARYVDPSTV